MDEVKLEQEIQATGATAPRLTPDMVSDTVVKERY